MYNKQALPFIPRILPSGGSVISMNLSVFPKLPYIYYTDVEVRRFSIKLIIKTKRDYPL
jgi:hypothetical protein